MKYTFYIMGKLDIVPDSDERGDTSPTLKYLNYFVYFIYDMFEVFVFYIL